MNNKDLFTGGDNLEKVFILAAVPEASSHISSVAFRYSKEARQK